MLLITVYCRSLIYKVPADATLGHPGVRRVRRYPMMQAALSAPEWQSWPPLSIGWKHLEEWIWEAEEMDGCCQAES